VKEIKVFLLFIFVTCTRLPFIFDGFGSEDDSWGLILNAQLMAKTGEYSFSRLPGHPLQEYLFSFFPNAPALFFNGLSALFSFIAAYYFYIAATFLKIRNALTWTLIFLSIPIIWISSVYTIDYLWALAFILAAFYYLLKEKLLIAGILLGCAIACRITSGAVLIGFLFMNGNPFSTQNLKRNLILGCTTLIVAMAWFTPAFLRYGISFFGTYPLPYPSLPKIGYKFSLGVWGATGFLAIIYLVYLKIKNSSNTINPSLLKGIYIIIALFTFAYFVYPQKSAFLITVVPFLLFIVADQPIPYRNAIFANALFFISPFIIGVNLNNKDRGADYSQFAITLNIANQEIFIDPFTGPLAVEKSRRITRQNFTDVSYQNYLKIKEKSVLLCGWWTNQFVVKVNQNFSNPDVTIAEFCNRQQLDSIIQAGSNIYYLKEINDANDERYLMGYTSKVGKLLGKY
jgi:hypothetical protein